MVLGLIGERLGPLLFRIDINDISDDFPLIFFFLHI